jgi:hypothetical protein
MKSKKRKKEVGAKPFPRIEVQIEKIPGKNLIVHKTIIVDVKPIAYYNECIERSG